MWPVFVNDGQFKIAVERRGSDNFPHFALVRG
jgi:hypothetical protein